MAVETATKIQDLNPLWPLGTDPKSEGDNHIRLIKSVLASATAGPLQNMVVKTFSSPGTTAYVKPTTAPFLKFLMVEIWGGGGGGGGCATTGATTVAAGAGGGGGGYTRKLYKASDLAASENLVIGAGGARGTNTVAGGSGGNSTFKGMTASGGSGGDPGAASATAFMQDGGTGGGTSGADLGCRGDYGQPGVRFPHAIAGAAMPGMGGGAYAVSQYRTRHSTTQINNGSPAVATFARGGDGSANGFSQSACSGMTGGDGFAILTEFF